MGDIVTENIFNWLTNEPIFANAAATISRVMDEIVSSEVFILRVLPTGVLRALVKDIKIEIIGKL